MFSPEQVHWEFKMDGRSYAAASGVDGFQILSFGIFWISLACPS
jgi:hypothetical protein